MPPTQNIQYLKTMADAARPTTVDNGSKKVPWPLKALAIGAKFWNRVYFRLLLPVDDWPNFRLMQLYSQPDILKRRDAKLEQGQISFSKIQIFNSVNPY